MKTTSTKQTINDYVANSLSANDKADFEAEMQMSLELRQEVAKLILKRLQNEQKVCEQVEKTVIERMEAQKIELTKKNNISVKDAIKQKWGKLFENLSSN